jgi:hypothetical protein
VGFRHTLHRPRFPVALIHAIAKISNDQIINAMSRYARIISIVTYFTAGMFLRTVDAITISSDSASDAAYADGWQAGDNGGTGFGPWTFAFSGNTNGLLYPPQFIDTAPSLPGNSLGAPTFALTTGDRRNQFETSEVRRTFVPPIAVGQTFSADVNGSALDSGAPAFTVGNTFDLLGTNGSERFSVFTNNEYHGGRWTATGDADTGIAPGNAFHIDFTLVTANSYNLVLSPVGGGVPYFTQTGAPLSGTAGVAISRLRVSNYGTGSSSEGSKELFFDNLVISEPDGIPGDYNDDNTVDAADYVVWRKQNLDTAAYNLWRTHFGEMAASIGAATSNSQLGVPEPNSHWVALLVVSAWPRARQHVHRLLR